MYFTQKELRILELHSYSVNVCRTCLHRSSHIKQINKLRYISTYVPDAKCYCYIDRRETRLMSKEEHLMMELTYAILWT